MKIINTPMTPKEIITNLVNKARDKAAFERSIHTWYQYGVRLGTLGKIRLRQVSANSLAPQYVRDAAKIAHDLL